MEFKKSMSSINLVDIMSSFCDNPEHGFSKLQCELCERIRDLAFDVFLITGREIQDFGVKITLCLLEYKTIDNVSKTLVFKNKLMDKLFGACL